jgi:hypothetical protein
MGPIPFDGPSLLQKVMAHPFSAGTPHLFAFQRKLTMGSSGEWIFCSGWGTLLLMLFTSRSSIEATSLVWLCAPSRLAERARDFLEGTRERAETSLPQVFQEGETI